MGKKSEQRTQREAVAKQRDAGVAEALRAMKECDPERWARALPEIRRDAARGREYARQTLRVVQDYAL